MGKAQSKVVIVLAVVAVVFAVVLIRQQGRRSEERFETRKVFDSVAIGEVARVESRMGPKRLPCENCRTKSGASFPGATTQLTMSGFGAWFFRS